MTPLNPDLEAKYKLTLANAAKELTAGESLPVDIERICFKVQLEHKRNILEYKTARLTGKSRIDLPASLLPQSGYYSANERYMIAHEIGHFVLTYLCAASPLGESEYWQFENLCNSFARQLLIPENILDGLPSSITSPKEAMGIASNLANKAYVPWMTSAWRLTERYTKFVFFYVTVKRNRLGLLCMRVTASTLPRKQLQHKILDTQVGLGLALKSLTQGKEFLLFCQKEAERSEIVSELPALGKVKEAYAIRYTSGSIYVAFYIL